MKQDVYILILHCCKIKCLAYFLTYVVYALLVVRYIFERAIAHKQILIPLTPQEAREKITGIWRKKELNIEIHNSPVNPDIDLSVIVPVYNYENVLEGMIRSILEQKTKYRIEVIFVDDGSNEAAKHILEKYWNCRNVTVITQGNKGISAARNTGLNAAVGKYIMFVDCDDCIHDDCVEILLDEAYRTDYDIIMAGHTLVKERDGEAFSKRDYIYSKHNLCNYRDGDFIMNYSGLPWGKLYKRELWENIRFPEGYWYEDTIIQFLVFRKAKSFSYLPISVYDYKWYEGNYSKVQHKSKDRALEHYWIVEAMIEENRRIGLPEDVILYKTILRHSGSYLYHCVKNFPEDVIQALFIMSKELLTQYRPAAGYHLNFQMKELEKAFDSSDYARWKLISGSML